MSISRPYSKLTQFLLASSLLTNHSFFLPEIVRPSETECTDKLEISEGKNILFSRCGTANKPFLVSSEKNVLNITIHSSSQIETKRGFVAAFHGIFIEYLSY